MSVTIKLQHSVIMPEVYKITGYTGVKSEDLDKISSTEDDVALLDSYFEEAMSYIQDVVIRFGGVVLNNKDAEIILNMPSNWNSTILSSLSRTMRQFTVNYICMQWFNLSKKEEVKNYEDSCERLTEAMKKYLFERVKPSRT